MYSINKTLVSGQGSQGLRAPDRLEETDPMNMHCAQEPGALFCALLEQRHNVWVLYVQ